jgi:tetratricopeptide (TPR) repeat protein
MTLADAHGNVVSTRSRAALDLYDRAAALFSRYQIDPLAKIDAALAEDPSFVMGHCFKASLLATTTEQAAEPAMAAALEAAERHVGQALPRERMYIGAARAWLARDFAGAVKLFGDIAVEYPRDLFALQIAHLGDFYLGQASQLRDRPAQALRAWGENEPARGFILGMQAFGFEETGDYRRAEQAGRRAVELHAQDSWAVHAVAHVFEMQGQTGQGIDWLESTSTAWAPDNFFAFHNWWHLALYHLDREDFASVLEVYDSHIRTAGSRIVVEMIDATALLWRLRLRGADVGDRWRELADAWQGFSEAGYYAFNDIHALAAFLAAGRDAEVRRVMTALQESSARFDTNGMMSREVGLPVARALCAFERGDHEMAIEDLLRVRGHAHRFGGSHAQRDLLNLTLLEASLRARRNSVTQALAAERLALKPASPFNRRMLRMSETGVGARL